MFKRLATSALLMVALSTGSYAGQRTSQAKMEESFNGSPRQVTIQSYDWESCIPLGPPTPRPIPGYSPASPPASPPAFYPPQTPPGIVTPPIPAVDASTGPASILGATLILLAGTGGGISGFVAHKKQVADAAKQKADMKKAQSQKVSG